MGQCPYKNGDLISLKEQYVVINPIDETPEYWIIESIQVSTKKKVLVKIFTNEGFPNIEALEQAWRDEVNKFESGDKSIPKNYLYIESGYVMFSGHRQFIIIFDDEELIQESGLEKEKASDKKDLPSTAPSEILPKDISEALDKVIEAYPEKQDEAIDDGVVKEAVKVESIDAGPSLEEAAELELAEEPELIEEPTIVEEIAEEPLKPSALEEISLPESAPPAPAAPPAGAPKTTQPRRRERKESSKRKIEAMPIPVMEDKRAVLATPVEEKDYLKHISMDYFDRMNPQNYYPLILKISDIIGETIIPTVNPLTGERKVQKKDEMEVTLKDPIVTIRPTIPGCSIVPSQIDTDFTLPDDEVTFFVTPGVKGEIVGHIEFINEDVTIYKTDFEAKVVDPNIARLVTIYGIIASFVPKILALLEIDFGLDSIFDPGTVLGTIGLTGLIALGGILPAILIGIGVRQKLKPKSSKTHFKLRDFRLKGIKPSKTL
ncbi:MAG: hypothetical protein FK733_07250 [Asgard group archaeon]|nr:hypothetical protein [Asgard group archaeon]